MKKKDMIIGLLIAIVLAIFSFLASSSPDGLERIAEDKNFLDKAASLIQAPIPDYLFPGIADEKISGALAGISGVLIVFFLTFLLGRMFRRKDETRLYR